eukprot:173228_1
MSVVHDPTKLDFNSLIGYVFTHNTKSSQQKRISIGKLRNITTHEVGFQQLSDNETQINTYPLGYITLIQSVLDVRVLVGHTPKKVNKHDIYFALKKDDNDEWLETYYPCTYVSHSKTKAQIKIMYLQDIKVNKLPVFVDIHHNVIPAVVKLVSIINSHPFAQHMSRLYQQKDDMKNQQDVNTETDIVDSLCPTRFGRSFTNTRSNRRRYSNQRRSNQQTLTRNISKIKGKRNETNDEKQTERKDIEYSMDSDTPVDIDLLTSVIMEIDQDQGCLIENDYKLISNFFEQTPQSTVCHMWYSKFYEPIFGDIPDDQDEKKFRQYCQRSNYCRKLAIALQKKIVSMKIGGNSGNIINYFTMANPSEHSLYLAKVPQGSYQEIETKFSECNGYQSIKLSKNIPGKAIVIFDTETNAKQAQSKFDNFQLEGSYISVKLPEQSLYGDKMLQEGYCCNSGRDFEKQISAKATRAFESIILYWWRISNVNPNSGTF